MCQFQSLSSNNDGYVIRCRQCQNFQVTFGNLLLTLVAEDFNWLCKIVKRKCNEEFEQPDGNIKSFIIETPCHAISFFLSNNELKHFNGILEEADTEIRALSLISLFNE